MAIQTKADLRDQVTDFMADQFEARDLNRSIAMCEAGIRRKLRLLDQEVTADIALSEETLTVPSRFLSARRLYIPGQKPMDYLNPDQLIRRQVERSNGRPRNYTLEGREDGLPFFRFAPKPDSEYTLRLTYLADQALVADDDTNVVLEKFPDIYFYGTIYHMLAFARNTERMPPVKLIYEAAIAEAEIMDIRDKIDGSSLVPRPSQVPA